MSHPANALTTAFSMIFQPLSYADLLHAHKNIQAFSPELRYERAAAYMYYAHISQLRSEQAALQSLAVSCNHLRTFADTLEVDLASLENKQHIS